jgi:hypothetical protein
MPEGAAAAAAAAATAKPQHAEPHDARWATHDGSVSGDNQPPPAPSSVASKCPKGALFIVTGTGTRGWPRGETRRCISDGKKWRCEHGRERCRCKECGGSGICEHGRRREACKDCGGSGICEHGRERRYCKECGGSQICEHGRRRSQCKNCDVNVRKTGTRAKRKAPAKANTACQRRRPAVPNNQDLPVVDSSLSGASAEVKMEVMLADLAGAGGTAGPRTCML